ncbi:hypothetical protein ACQEUU_26890 [Nonomuraea sp. CA-218870]|uniref:Uncharacterized protein n=1 Tax=Nonomuraea corallina TaxID=2989783 RepID=A0ABT4S7S9_9ACTN|nr:hypothetical protein [Nonomuraea corallina]MDA0633205.1 hypothetical protein [Nonomuraea corallina]
MSTPDENAPKTDTEPLLEAAQDDQEPVEEPGTEPRTQAGQAMRRAMRESGKNLDDLT